MATSKERGFVLVEALAALGVAALSATALMTALSAANARSAEADIRMAALRQAQLLLAEGVDAPDPSTLESRGALAGKRLTWVRSFGDAGEAFPNLQRVNVEVVWSTVSRKGAMRLEAYRISFRP